MNKKEILDEIKKIDDICNSPYNNDGLYNEMRIMKNKLLEKLKILEGEENES